MALRQLQIIVPKDTHGSLLELLEEADPPSIYSHDINDGLVLTGVSMRMELVEPISDAVMDKFEHADGFRISIFALEAMYPKPPEPEKEEDPDLQEEKKWSPRFGRVSREELIEDIEGSAKTTPVSLIMVTLATIVASVGLIKDSPAIVIGAMVIAPLLGPNIALALGTTLGDVKMVKRAAVSNLVGLSLALLISVLFGLYLTKDGVTDEMTSRSVVDLGDILLALASGAAGAIAFTSGASQIVVGVMVAVALLPPTAVCGMLLGERAWNDAGGAALLVATNVVCINLSATAVFRVQRISPTRWWEQKRAKGASVRAIVMWTATLAALAVLIVLAGGE